MMSDLERDLRVCDSDSFMRGKGEPNICSEDQQLLLTEEGDFTPDNSKCYISV
jgi:hypothetical protein